MFLHTILSFCTCLSMSAFHILCFCVPTVHTVCVPTLRSLVRVILLCVDGTTGWHGLFQAADYIAATAARHSLLTSFPIHQVKGVTGPEPAETTTNVKYVFIGVVLVLLASLLIGVLVAAQRKRAQGITWFPEGFFRNNRFVCLHALWCYLMCVCVSMLWCHLVHICVGAPWHHRMWICIGLITEYPKSSTFFLSRKYSDQRHAWWVSLPWNGPYFVWCVWNI